MTNCQSITVTSVDEMTTLVVDGEMIAERSSGTDERWEPIPIVEPGAQIMLANSTPEEWQCLEEALRPSESMLSLIEEFLDEEKYHTVEPDEQNRGGADPSDDDITVNGELWTWFDPLGRDEWILIPTEGQKDLVAVGMWMSESMTGASMAFQVFLLGPVMVTEWPSDDLEGSIYEIHFPTEAGFDIDDRCRALVSSYFGPFDVCPAIDTETTPCSEEWDGWELSISASPDLTVDTVSALLGHLWRPCGNHGAEASIDAAERTWRWVDNRWVPAT